MSQDNTNIAISVNAVSKRFKTYPIPADRLLQFIYAGIHALAPSGLKPKLKAKIDALGFNFQALENISFQVKRGTTVGIIGKNGSGKSTLLQIVYGTLNPTAGQVTTHGRVAALLELGSGFNPEYTGRDNVYLNAQLLGLTRAEVDVAYDSILAFAEIGEFIHQPVKTYSSGMMVRLAFAVIAHVKADILIIDEALAVGDAYFTQKCMRFLRGFMANNTVLFVSHDAGSIMSLCSEAVWLENGQIKMQGEAKAVGQEYAKNIQQKLIDNHIVSVDVVPQAPTQAQENFLAKAVGETKVELFDNIAFSEGWKTGHAEIRDVKFVNMAGQTLSMLEGGESVRLSLTAHANEVIASPILGFFVKDKLGQALFGEHSYNYTNSAEIKIDNGQYLTSVFEFVLPMLPDGDYSITVSIAEGDPHVHTQHHWLHDAVLFKVSSTRMRYGLVGLKMNSVTVALGV